MKITWLAAALAAACSLSCAHAAPAPQIDYRIVDRIAGPDGGWDFAATDSAGGRVYIARSDAIARIDIATRKAEILASARRAHQVLVLDGGATIFETDGESGMGRFVAGADGKVLAEIATGTKPDAAFIDPVTGLIAVMNAGDGTVALIDPKSRALVGKITVGGAPARRRRRAWTSTSRMPISFRSAPSSTASA